MEMRSAPMKFSRFMNFRIGNRNHVYDAAMAHSFLQSDCKTVRPNTSGRNAHTNARIRIVNKHRNVADKLGWEPRRKYATPRFSIGFCALETNSSRDTTDRAHC